MNVLKLKPITGLTRITIKLLLIYSIGSCSTNQSEYKGEIGTYIPQVQKPDRVLKVGFLAVNGVYNSELIAPMDILHHTVFHTDPGMEVFVVAPTNEPIVTFEGLHIIPDYNFEDAPYIDVLIVPSARHSMDSDLEDEELIDFVRERGSKASYVMSLCDGAFVLAKAGLTDGHESTTFPSDISSYRKMFPDLVVHEGISFVHDRNLITSAGGAKSYDPALYLVELLYGRKAAKGIAGGLVIEWDLGSIDHIIVK